MATLEEFLLARIAEDEAAARAVPPLDHNFDMGGNRQDERFVFDRALPSSADGMGNWSKHRGDATAAHFSRHDPARVLAECAAKRRVIELAAESCAAADRKDADQVTRSFDAGAAFVAHNVLLMLVTAYANHPDHDETWRA